MGSVSSATAAADALTWCGCFCFVEKIDQIAFAADGAFQGG
jgi:hypothetical protein